MSTLTITTIQADLRWEDKAANLRRFEEKIVNLRERTEIVILPEMFSTGFSMRPEAFAEKMDGPTIGWMRNLAQKKKIILTGSLIIEENGHYFNRLCWVLPNGDLGCYDKRHRFAYAGEDEQYTAGHKRLIASVKGWKINCIVCYDLRFPVWSRQANRSLPLLPDSEAAGKPEGTGKSPDAPAGRGNAPEYDLLICVANWPERRGHAWKTLLQARAIENQVYVAGVNRVGADGHGIAHSGDSMIVDPLGEVLWQNKGEEAIHTETLDRQRLDETRGKFPFWRDADHFFIEP